MKRKEKVPRIFFASRTHSQLTQVAQALKALPLDILRDPRQESEREGRRGAGAGGGVKDRERDKENAHAQTGVNADTPTGTYSDRSPHTHAYTQPHPNTHTYIRPLRLTILGSREQYCIHPSILKKSERARRARQKEAERARKEPYRRWTKKPVPQVNRTEECYKLLEKSGVCVCLCM